MNSESNFEIVFWGIRGSYPALNSSNKYGTNTSCVEIIVEGKRFIFDSGSGIIPLGRELNINNMVKNINIFLSHYHLDHIQGITHFIPMYNSSANILISGPMLRGITCKNAISELFNEPYHPIGIEAVNGNIGFSQVSPNEKLSFGQVEIEAIDLSHPNGSVGYRVSYMGKSCCYITDVELSASSNYSELCSFIEETDMLIIDAMYTKEDFNEENSKKGWGHSSWCQAVDLGSMARVKKIALFHINPEKSDHEIDAILKLARGENPNAFIPQERIKYSL